MTIERARVIAADRATVTPISPNGNDAFRVTGCTYDEGVSVAMDISRELHPQTDRLPPGWPGRFVSADSNFVAVWL
jgi:hypothetical protein